MDVWLEWSTTILLCNKKGRPSITDTHRPGVTMVCTDLEDQNDNGFQSFNLIYSHNTTCIFTAPALPIQLFPALGAKLYCNPAKCQFFLLELDFLSHHISACEVKAHSSKVRQILDWHHVQKLDHFWVLCITWLCSCPSWLGCLMGILRVDKLDTTPIP